MSSGGGRPHVHFIPVQVRQQGAGARQGAGLDGTIGQAVRDQEAAARRLAEEQHKKAQLRAALSAVQPPEVQAVAVFAAACHLSPPTLLRPPTARRRMW